MDELEEREKHCTFPATKSLLKCCLDIPGSPRRKNSRNNTKKDVETKQDAP